VKKIYSSFSPRFKCYAVTYMKSLSRQQQRKERPTIALIPRYNTAKSLLSNGIYTEQGARKFMTSIQKKESNENLMSNKRKPNRLRPQLGHSDAPHLTKSREKRGRKSKGAKDIMQYFSNHPNQPKKPMIKIKKGNRNHYSP